MAATVQYAGKTLQGCAFLPWDQDFLALLPAINACLSRVQKRTVEDLSVIYAGRESNRDVFVRLRTMERDTNDEDEFDCHVSSEAIDEPPTITHADQGVDFAGIGRAIFVPASSRKPGGECYEVDEIRASDGALLGWWDAPEGC